MILFYICGSKHKQQKQNTMYTNNPEPDPLKLGEAFSRTLANFAVFRGRARRSEFWWFMLISHGALAVLYLLSSLTDSGILSLLFILMWLGIQLPKWSSISRRLHDTGHSAWLMALPIACIVSIWIIVIKMMGHIMDSIDMESIRYMTAHELEASLMAAITPYGIPIGIWLTLAIPTTIVMIIFCCYDSQPRPNKWGDSPKYQPQAPGPQVYYQNVYHDQRS